MHTLEQLSINLNTVLLFLNPNSDLHIRADRLVVILTIELPRQDGTYHYSAPTQSSSTVKIPRKGHFSAVNQPRQHFK